MNLPPGRYAFKVKGSNNDGIWNPEPAVLRIVITPPFWQTWWFRLLAVLIVLALGYIWFRRRLRNVRMKTELQTAHDAQMSVMPQEDPVVPGYDISGLCAPAFEVGGDFFDYFCLQRGELFCVAVGDVSGKAMNSAMTAVLSSGMLSAHAEQAGSIGEIMTRLNGPMYRKTDRKMFTALCLLALHINDHRVSFTNAGIPQPLLKRGGAVRELQSDGPRLPLGSVPDIAYGERDEDLHPGDVIVVYTDGLSEAVDGTREFYGAERLQRFLAALDTSGLPAAAIKQRIIDDVQEFVGGSARSDDMTVVVIKVSVT
jgi:sigma-B regulation protein RsbU (phosphoserine phosphatase)